MQKGTALVVGATGIVGGNLAAYLAASGWTVYGLSRRPADTGGIIPVQADLLDACQNGIADVVYAAPLYISDRLPLSTVAALPLVGNVTERKGLHDAWHTLLFDTLNEIEYAPQGVRVIRSGTTPAYQLMMRGDKVMSIVRSIRAKNGQGRDNDPDFHTRMKPSGVWADLFRARFRVACKRAGLGKAKFELDCTQFRPPAVGGQLRLL